MSGALSEPRPSISAIVPTIGRADSLRRLLHSLAEQTVRADEVVIADGSGAPDTERLIAEPEWAALGLTLRHIPVQPPNAVRQRQQAIAASHGEMLLMLDDDVKLAPDCTAEMLRVFAEHADAVGVMADFDNQVWSLPTLAWRAYLRGVLRLKPDAWQGRVVGPLLRFGYNPVPAETTRIEWMGAGNSMMRRATYEKAGGFSSFFLHRCTMNEDVDLALKLRRHGRLYFEPKARLSHHHAPGGRVTPAQAAADDIHNRYQIMVHTLGEPPRRAASQVLLFVAIESVSNFAGAIRHGRWRQAADVFGGRAQGLKAVFRGASKEVKS